jgi:cyclomaltodextrinase / maltogenic alpha-amylase / neopullulanase
MSLLDTTVWWHVYPLGATGAPWRGDELAAEAGQVVHRLPLLLAWVDYAADLGCTGLLLGPVFASATHGYDTLDHFRIDPRLGDDADFDALVERASARGMAVMLDGVFNHVGREHPLVATFDAADPAGAMIRLDDVDGVLRPRGWEGHGDLVELDHGDPRVADLVVDVMTHWLRRGIAGWRLDVAYAVPPEFWREALARVRADHPDAVFLGEVIHGDYAEIARAGTLDSVTQYELWKAIWSSLVDQNLWELAWALVRHDEFSRDVVLNTFVGNHDVPRIASTVGDSGAALAAVLLMTLPGMPSVYYGDEQAFRGVKGEGFESDDALRPGLPASPSALDPHGRSMHGLYRRLIALRRDNAWLARARLKVDDKTSTSITYTCSGEGRVLVASIVSGTTPSARVAVDGARVLHWPG